MIYNKSTSSVLMASLLLILSGYFLGKSILSYQTLRTHSANLTVSTNIDGKIVITGYAYMDEGRWKYFRGMPLIELHGIDLPSFFSAGGKLSFEIQNQDSIRKIDITEEQIKKQERSLYGKNYINNNGATYRIYPSVIVYKDIQGKKFVDGQKSHTLNYQEGINIITLTLDHFAGDKNNISGKLIFDAFGKRVLWIFPLLAAILCILLSSVILFARMYYPYRGPISISGSDHTKL